MLTLIADRFVRDADGRVLDLATGEPVTLVETTLRTPGEQRARREQCEALMDAQGPFDDLGFGVAWPDFRASPDSGTSPGSTAPPGLAASPGLGSSDSGASRGAAASSDLGPPPDLAMSDSDAPTASRAIRVVAGGVPKGRLVDFALVGDARWIEAYAATSATVAVPFIGAAVERGTRLSRDTRAQSCGPVPRGSRGGSSSSAALDGVMGALDSLRAGDVRRLYVKAPRASYFTSFVAAVAREARGCGFVPVCPSVVEQSPAVAAVLRMRSVLLLGVPPTHVHSLARLLVTLTRLLATVVGVIVRVAERVAVAALRLPLLPGDRGYVRSGLDAPSARLARVAEPIAATPMRASVGGIGRVGHAYPFKRTDIGRVSIRRRPPRSSPWSEGSLAIPVMSDTEEEIEEFTMEGSDADCESLALPVVTTTMSGYGEAADALVRRGRWAAACRALRSRMAGYERREASTDVARTALALGRLFLALADVTNAVRWLDHAGEHAARAGDARLIADILRWSGVAALEQADLDRSERLLRTALAAAGPSTDPRHLIAIDLTLARCLFWQGRFDEIVLPAIESLPAVASPRSPPDRRLDEGPAVGPRSAAVVGAGRAGDPRAAVGSALIVVSNVSVSAGVGVGDGARAVVGAESNAEATILRVTYWRMAARLAMAHGDLSRAGDALARACRLARGDGEDDVRSGACYLDEGNAWSAMHRKADAERDQRDRAGTMSSSGESLRRGSPRSGAASLGQAPRGDVGSGLAADAGGALGRGGAPSRARATARRARLGTGWPFKQALQGVDADLRVACHLDAARLQLAIGDWAACDVHVRECLALPRAAARTRRLQVLQMARARGDRRIESRRQVERLSAALRQAHVPALIRIRARYLVESRSRRAAELTTFLARHGEAALAGRAVAPDGEGQARDARDVRGGSPMLDAFQAVLQICHETPDDLTALGRVCTYLRDRLQAAHVAIYGAPLDRGRLAFAGSSRLVSSELAARVIDSGLPIPPTYRADALDAAAPIRYSTHIVGGLVARWIVDATIDHTSAGALLSAAATALAPQVRATLDRYPVNDSGLAAAAAGDASSSASSSSAPSTASSSSSAAAILSSASSTSSSAVSASASAHTLGLLGVSEAIEKLRQTIGRVASAPFHVLIEGESGSGKELVARALHHYGPRRHRRFCAVNCAALTDELLEAELFGHTRGAFTGAMTERAGLFEEADHGTLFLDEIGELSARGQAKLLRVIQDGETRRIGENMPRRVDARIVAATNRSLRDEAEAGQFREDLLYRLDVIRIVVPPLRARMEDVPILARAFWIDATSRTGSRATLDPDTLAALARYHWPGNVRELHNAIMALAVHAPARGRVPPSLLPTSITGLTREKATRTGARNRGRICLDDESAVAVDDAECEAGVTLDAARRAFESRFVRAALARAGGHTTRAAQELGLTREGLRRLMMRLGLHTAARAGATMQAEPEPEAADGG